MRSIKPIIAAAALTFSAGSANALSVEPAAGPSAGNPLSPVCDLICAGTWEPDHPAYADEIRISMHYEWDAQTGSIKGTMIRMGGVAGIREVTAIVIAWDNASQTITVTRTPEKGDAIAGVLTPGDDGFQMRFQSPSTPGEAMTTLVRFPETDLWIERSEITGNGQSALGTEVRYRRAP